MKDKLLLQEVIESNNELGDEVELLLVCTTTTPGRYTQQVQNYQITKYCTLF